MNVNFNEFRNISIESRNRNRNRLMVTYCEKKNIQVNRKRVASSCKNTQVVVFNILLNNG